MEWRYDYIPATATGMGPHAKPNLAAHPQTHLGSTTRERRLGRAIFELRSLTQLIFILQEA